MEVLAASLIADDVSSPISFAVIFEPGNPPVRIIVLGLDDIDVLVSIHVAHPGADGYAELVRLAQIDVLSKAPFETSPQVFIPTLGGHYVVIAVTVKIRHCTRRNTAMHLMFFQWTD